MARQYARKGLRALAVDASLPRTGQEPSADALLNTIYDWNMQSLPLLRDAGARVAHRYGARRAPATFLIAPDGRVLRRWDGLALAQQLDQAIQGRVGGIMRRSTPR